MNNINAASHNEHSRWPSIQELCDSIRNAVQPQHRSTYARVFQALMNHKSGTENERRAKVLLFFVQLSEKYRASNNRFQEAKKIMPIYINDNTTPGWYEMFRTLLYDTRELDLNSISTKLKALKKPTKLEEKNLLFSQQILNELTRDGAQPRRGEIGEEDIEFPFVKMNIKPGKINEASKYFNEHPEPIEE